jgi:hypothetical protein
MRVDIPESLIIGAQAGRKTLFVSIDDFSWVIAAGPDPPSPFIRNKFVCFIWTPAAWFVARQWGTIWGIPSGEDRIYVAPAELGSISPVEKGRISL